MPAYESMRELGSSVESEQAEATSSEFEPTLGNTAVAKASRKSKEVESELVRRLKARDEQALEIIINLYSAMLYNVAHRILCEVADSEEVVEYVFWTAYRKDQYLRGDVLVWTW